jgi:hypothetical protein
LTGVSAAVSYGEPFREVGRVCSRVILLPITPPFLKSVDCDERVVLIETQPDV